jgi:hypothetical protein
MWTEALGLGLGAAMLIGVVAFVAGEVLHQLVYRNRR